MDCSLLGVGCSNKKKRKHAESDNEEEKEWVPIPKLTNVGTFYQFRFI